MHLKSLTLKGFKSFPDRTRLEFGPGVSVIVGPNGSGKSNITDAVLWVMGEQSPLAVRGRSMQDVIFGGGKGVTARSAAEVEVVLDNGDGAIDLPVGEIAISRRLDRSGDGEYRINGARCRLVDVLELLSDTGLGKEAHSVISQGRIEAIVTSKPRDRRLLIEEAAGLGKHRKRRRRAQLKLARTQDNLDRALDVEREARARLRPLKRQAEAAELHARLARQTAEVRWELAREQLRVRRAALAGAERDAAAARAARDAAQAELGEVAARRAAAEEALALRSERRERLATRLERARAAAERIGHRLERVREAAGQLAADDERAQRQLARLREQERADGHDDGSGAGDRIAALEAGLAALDADRAAALERELAALGEQQQAAAARVAAAAAEVARCRDALAAADAACELSRGARRAAGQSAEAARREAAAVGAELARANQFLRTSAEAGAAGRTLADELTIEPGLELALAAALGARLSAAVVPDRPAGGRALDAAGADGARVLVAGGPVPAATAVPAPGARRLAELVTGPEPALAVARRLLADAWVLERVEDAGDDFAGIAVTPAGRVWSGLTRELRQVATGGAERVLAVRNERERLLAETERVLRAEQEAERAVETAAQAALASEASRDEAERTRREAERAEAEATESLRRVAWLIDERRRAPEQGESALRRAQLEGELAAERRVAEQAARQRRDRREQIGQLERFVTRAAAIAPCAARMAEALEQLRSAATGQVARLEAERDADRAAGEDVAAELRACATAEAAVQQRIAACGEAVTAAAVAHQQARDGEHEAASALIAVATELGLDAEPREEPLAADEAQALTVRLERLERRRAQIGPVNPLAADEYAEAVAHVEELERRREDLETALRELGTLIRDTDRQIRETFTATFEAAARNFEELAATLFPGGRGRLTLVHEQAPVAPLTGTGAPAAERAEAAAEAEEQAQAPGIDPDELLGVEIEITPAGKQMKRLSLLSGGEKTMTAIAFLFSVFLARPCPFYILDEVEAALDDRNITRYLDLLAAHAGRAQFIIVTHQKRTMEAADTLYGVSMGGDGVSQVVSRRMTGAAIEERTSVGAR